MEKEIVYFGLEFLFGPIQKFKENEKGKIITGIETIDKDEILQKLDKDINNLLCSLLSKDSNSPSGMHFDEVKENDLAPQLLEMINKLIDRLNEINDGSYEIEDMITDHLKSLID